MQVRNIRTGKWIELPDDDGLVPIPRWTRGADGKKRCRIILRSPEAVHQNFASMMERFDRLPPKHRWTLAYKGLNSNRPIDLTTPSVNDYICTTKSIDDILGL